MVRNKICLSVQWYAESIIVGCHWHAVIILGYQWYAVFYDRISVVRSHILVYQDFSGMQYSTLFLGSKADRKPGSQAARQPGRWIRII